MSIWMTLSSDRSLNQSKFLYWHHIFLSSHKSSIMRNLNLNNCPPSLSPSSFLTHLVFLPLNCLVCTDCFKLGNRCLPNLDDWGTIYSSSYLYAIKKKALFLFDKPFLKYRIYHFLSLSLIHKLGQGGLVWSIKNYILSPK